MLNARELFTKRLRSECLHSVLPATSRMWDECLKLDKDFDRMTPEYSERAAFGGSGNRSSFGNDLEGRISSRRSSS